MPARQIGKPATMGDCFMIELPVYNEQGQQVDKIQVDEAIFGSVVRHKLLKQAVVMYLANKRQGTAATKSRGMVEGSTRKLFRQKGTGRARMGTIRTNVRRGGGVAFAKASRDFSQKMPKKARRLARNSALLSKMKDGEMLILESLNIDEPKTKRMTGILGALGIDGSCLIGLADSDKNVYLSTRNIEKVNVMPVDEFNAYDLLTHKKVVLTKAGFDKLKSLAGGTKENENAEPASA